jgi:hypothetical protein
MSATPLYRGQGNKPFETAKPVSAAKRGQTVPYDVNGAPAGGSGRNSRTLALSIIDLPQARWRRAPDPLAAARELVDQPGGERRRQRGWPRPPRVFPIRKNGVQVGTVTFAAGSTTGTIAFTDSIFPAGSLFELWPPSPIDGALDRVSISLP